MKSFVSKLLIVAMVFSVLCFYPAKDTGSVEVRADEGESTTEVVTTTQSVTTTPATTTQKPTTVPTTTAVVKKTPAKVTNLKISDKKNASLKVSWKKSSLATEYWVYRSKETKGKMPSYKKYKTLKKLSFIDTGLEQGTVYKYKVVAYRKADGYTTKSAGAEITTMTVIDPVKTFKAKAGSKSIKLTFKKNSKATKYYLYRANENSSVYKKIKKISKKKTSYTDKKVKSGQVYQYKLVVYRKKFGVKSTSQGKFTSAMTSLSAPSKLTSSEKATKITLKWNAVNNAEKYEVYKGKKLVKTTTKLTYTQKGLKKRHAYKFKVRAVRRYKGKTYKSAFAEISASTNIGMKGSWIEICIKTQTLRMYIKNKLYVKTPVVTGNVGDRHTSKGNHTVLEKTAHRQLKGSYHGQTWDVTVNYWLKFTGDSQGIHDSTWRSAYGGNIYKTNGSHGCVNTPLGAMKKIFKKAHTGMPVIVY
ncbi:MAG: L,D-transpeptidase family protein [Eubacterium sp.]|nr:L,D-transpeptidase family protein [Eubacterium sp.]